VSAIWVIAGLGLGLAAVLAIVLRYRHLGAEPPDLGSVSQQWMAERRLDHHRDGYR